MLPGLFHLARAGLLPARYRIIGSARSALTDDEFRRRAKEAVTQFGRAEPTGPAWRAFADSLSFGAAQPTQPQPLLDAVAAAEQAIGGHPRRLFHLAVPPAGFELTIGSRELAVFVPDELLDHDRLAGIVSRVDKLRAAGATS